MSTNAPTPAPESTSSDEPSVVGLKVRPVVPLVLYAVLAASAGLALWAQRAPEAPPALGALAPWLFLLFAIGFSVYRLALVFARRYRAYKAFVQIGIAGLFAVLLLGPQLGATVPSTPRAVGPLAQALSDADAQTRALAAEVAGFRHDLAQGPALVRLLSDASGEVRLAAHDALVRLNDGADLGPAESADARAAWKGRFP